MTDDQQESAWLRSGLAALAPEPPTGRDAERVTTARRLDRVRRRRRTAVVAVAAAVLLAVAVPIGGRDASDSSAPSATPTEEGPGYVASDTSACETPDEPRRPGPDVPSDPLSVSLCLPDDQGIGGDLHTPADVLTDDLDSLVSVINDAPLRSVSRGCTADAGLNYELVFTYPGGRRTWVNAGLYGCGFVMVGDRPVSRARTNAEQVWTTYTTMLAAHRAAATAPGASGEPPSCPPSGPYAAPSTLGGRPDQMETARLCVYGALTDDPAVAGSVVIDADDLAVLVRDLGAADEPADYCDESGGSRLLIMGVTSWNDLVSSVSEGCDAFHLGDATWVPTGEAANILERLEAEATAGG